jgi:hypothetical protein
VDICGQGRNQAVGIMGFEKPGFGSLGAAVKSM